MRYTYFDHPVHNVLIHFTIINQSNTTKSCLQVLPLEIRGCALNAHSKTQVAFLLSVFTSITCHDSPHLQKKNPHGK